MTNFIMNVAAIAISLPVALVIAPYLGVAGEVIVFSSLVVAGMPFLLLVGAAPNAIAYTSKQFTTGEFFTYGIPASILLMVVTWIAVQFIWPLMGMPVVATPANAVSSASSFETAEEGVGAVFDVAPRIERTSSATMAVSEEQAGVVNAQRLAERSQDRPV